MKYVKMLLVSFLIFTIFITSNNIIAASLPTINIEEKEIETSDKGEIIFVEDNEYMLFNITLTDDAAKLENYVSSITYVMNGIVEELLGAKLTIVLESSLDNTTWTEVTSKELKVNEKVDLTSMISISQDITYFRVSIKNEDKILNFREYNIDGKLKVKVDYIVDFEYTGDSQEFEAPIDGNYRIELWGASGNYYKENEVVIAGAGAYTAGSIELKEGDKLYIYTGRNATDGTAWYEATFGGGGAGGALRNGNPIGNIHYGASGGGATDVRLLTGNWNDSKGLASRIMVAAGGGGALYKEISGSYGKECSGAGGAGGGLVGYPGQKADMLLNYDWLNLRYPKGGNQNAGGKQTACLSIWDDSTEFCSLVTQYPGSFGIGGQHFLYNGTYHLYSGAGGGGGYYGGAGSAIGMLTAAERPLYNNTTGHGAAAGGSSYISGHQGSISVTGESDLTPKCSVTLTDELPTSLDYVDVEESCSVHYSDIVFTDTVMIDGEGYTWTNKREEKVEMPKPDGGSFDKGNTGSGAAKIEILDGSIAESELVKVSYPAIIVPEDPKNPDTADGANILGLVLLATFSLGSIVFIRKNRKVEL